MNLRGRIKNILLLLAFCASAHAARPLKAPEQFRGYYITFMRMPLWGLPEWKEAFDCLEEDRVNTVILWTAGGFRSRTFPITWEYNREHKNVQHDFLRELIDYAHAKKIRVLLGFTPFGYDGVNQFTITHPELKARKADGSPVDEFGIHCWGWSLCPSRDASQQFMLGYAREMIFDFYPNADGLMIESSDYNVCRCSECSTNYYQREFSFVRKISDELWSKKPEATIFVYPHYFSGRKVNQGTAIESQAAQLPFDRRWSLVFTPHSAHFEPDLIAKASSSIFSNEGLSLGTPTLIHDGIQTARSMGVTGYIPSLEPFSYLMTRQEFRTGGPGKRTKPLGFDWLADGQMPLRELPVRLLRFAYREYSDNPNLSDADFHRKVAVEFFNSSSNLDAADDLLFLQSCINLNRDWTWSSPLVDPALFQKRCENEKWKADHLEDCSHRLIRLKTISQRYTDSTNLNATSMCTIANYICRRWGKTNSSELLLPR